MHSQAANVSYGNIPYGSYPCISSQLYNTQTQTNLENKENIPQLPLSKDELTKIVSNALDDKLKKVPKDMAEKTALSLKDKLTRTNDNLKATNNELKCLGKELKKKLAAYKKTSEELSENIENISKELNVLISHYIDTERLLKKAIKSAHLSEYEEQEIRTITEKCEYKRHLAFMDLHKNIFMQEGILKDLKKLLEDKVEKFSAELMVLLEKDERSEVEEQTKKIKEGIEHIKEYMKRKEVKPLKIESKGFDFESAFNKLMRPSLK
jgi:uncharacterized phage infection (PIP) family protein YhgE